MDATGTPLLLSRRFAPLFWCQFCAAFNDNFLKSSLVFLILFGDGGDRAGTLITLASGVLIAPYFVLSGLGAGLGGILVAGRIGSGYPNAGQAFELDSIVAVVLGGTSLAGGRGSVAGTVAAVLLLAVASNVLNLLEVPTFMQTITKGCIVVVAVLLGQRAAAAER